MPVDLEGTRQFLSDVTDEILMIAGAFFLFLAVAFFTRAYQLLSMVLLPVGVLLAVVGVVLHFEDFTLKIPSLEGWGTISICASAVLVALAVGLAFYAVPAEQYLVPLFQREGGRKPALWYSAHLLLDHPNLWLSQILIFGGAALLIFGFFLKFRRDIF